MTRMKRILCWLALAMITLSVASCGIPQLLGRTVNNTARQVGSLGSSQ